MSAEAVLIFAVADISGAPTGDHGEGLLGTTRDLADNRIAFEQ